MSIKSLKVINKLISYFKNIKMWLIKPKPAPKSSKPVPADDPGTFYTTVLNDSLNKSFKYAVYIQTLEHSDPFNWDDPYVSLMFLEQIREAMIRWALSSLIELKPTSPEDKYYPQMVDWFSKNIVGEFKATAFGHKQTTCVYCFFKKEEDAVLFKMTWL